MFVREKGGLAFIGGASLSLSRKDHAAAAILLLPIGRDHIKYAQNSHLFGGIVRARENLTAMHILVSQYNDGFPAKRDL